MLVKPKSAILLASIEPDFFPSFSSIKIEIFLSKSSLFNMKLSTLGKQALPLGGNVWWWGKEKKKNDRRKIWKMYKLNQKLKLRLNFL